MSEFVVLDTEFTTWEGALARNWSGPGEYRELVQIGAVLVDGGFHELASFEVLARPRRNPVLSDYFVALTGITQERLESEGVEPEQALDRFLAFAGPDRPLLSNGPDGVVLAENCALLGRPDPFLCRSVDVHAQLKAACGGVRFSSCDLPALLNLPPVAGRAHTALADARCVAAALAKVSAGEPGAFL